MASPVNVYAAKWCPHCRQTIEFLNQHNIEIDYFEIEEQPEEVVQKVIDANGGFDWVVPTLEYQGKWRPGKVFNEEELKADLLEMGIIGE